MTERSVATADLARIVVYLDGNLSAEEMLDFERRLGREPDLAEAMEDFDRIDRLQRAHIPYDAAHGSADGRAPAQLQDRLGLRWRVLAAAATLLVLSYLVSRWSGPSPLEGQVAVVSSVATLRESHRLLDLPPEHARKLPSGFVLRGDDGEEEEITPEDYRDLVGPLHERRIKEALASPAPVTAGYFLVPFRPTHTCSAIAVLLDSAGTVVGGWSEEARFQEGQVHVLPGRNVALIEEPPDQRAISYRPGFLVPRGAGSVQILLGLREEPYGPQVQSELTQLLAEIRTRPQAVELTTERIRAWMKNRSFTVRELEVREP